MSSTDNNNITNRNVATYKWVIDNFSNAISTSHHQTSPHFGFPIIDENEFELSIDPSTTKSFDDPFVSIYTRRFTCSGAAFKAKQRMSILNAKGDKCYTQEGIYSFEFPVSYSVPRYFLLVNELLVNDTLTVVCEIELVHDGEDGQAKDFGTISKHYESLLESSMHSDVVLAIGDKEFRAHKLVLSARSPVFAAMFDHSDMKEAQQGRVEIVDVEVEVFELFLRYIYTGKIDQLDRFAHELLSAADMYQMDCLKSLCEHFFCSNYELTIENVSEMLIQADLYRAETLKAKCIDYITDNSEQVRATEEWKAVTTKADLLVHLFDKMSIKLNSANTK